MKPWHWMLVSLAPWFLHHRKFLFNLVLAIAKPIKPMEGKIMNAQLIALLQKLEADGLADLGTLLVPAIFAEIQTLSAANATVSSIEAVVFPAVQPAVQAALVSLIAKVPPIS